MSNSKHALPKGSRVLVTGANGYIASHVVDQLLSHGYLVRGTIRAPKPWLSEYFAQKYGDVFEAVIVTCFENRDDINRVLDGVDGIIHLISAALPDSWSDEAVKAAWDPNTPDESKGFKTEAEREAWTWVRGHKPEYTFNTVLPCMTVILCKIIGAITRSADQLHNMLEDPSPGDLRFHDGVDPQTLERRSHGFVGVS
ncbi:hypothetical protein COH20_011523 [Aspergillus flavus]|uniref:NAD-dependent epimerase/dehydratase domain-containing protein n=1 Tax=Aspergillus flavus TaxID=5059 RepID=A0AB74C756_ASPFL|nr:hypothetical protein COH20_011523 [Aspergillus flavus]RAQ78236.1 hypothetical protein COH21_008494 [Aspergillus flavus]RMZ42515.1 hypothetical protein CA14_002904 [Aspergillus flavus]